MIWVIIQALLFAVLIFPSYTAHFNIPDWYSYIDRGLTVLGFLILLRAAYDLRKSLAVAPTPKENGQLQVRGIYGYIRHPMYLAVWLILGSGAIASGSYSKIAVFSLLVVFFIIKTRHEEKLLIDKYKDYNKYMKSVGAYLPRL